MEKGRQVRNAVSIRPANPDDSPSLTFFVDAATRRLASHTWQTEASAGRSLFEIGREAIRTDPTKALYYANWQVAEVSGRVAGGLNGYVLPRAPYLPDPAGGAPELRPLNELKIVAAGAWHISAAAVFPEFRNGGVGQALIEHAVSVTRSSGATRTTLIVGSFNPSAQRLYRRVGFREWHKRPFVPFPGSDTEGEWILMCRDL